MHVYVSLLFSKLAIPLLAEEVKLVQVWQRGHKEGLKAVDGWIVEEGESQRGLLLQPLVPLSAHPSTEVQVASRVDKDNIKGGVEGV